MIPDDLQQMGFRSQAQYALTPPMLPVGVANPSFAESLFQLVVVGGTAWLVCRAIGSLFNEPRDTFKYVYLQGNKVSHGGITNDLDRRESEHRRRWPSGRIRQVGRRTTHTAARGWEQVSGF